MERGPSNRFRSFSPRQVSCRDGTRWTCDHTMWFKADTRSDHTCRLRADRYMELAAGDVTTGDNTSVMCCQPS